MDLEAYLKCHGLSVSDLKAAIDATIRCEPEDVLIVTGSLVEGIGNVHSDVDVFLVTGRDLGSLSVGPIIPVPCGDRAIDVEWRDPAEFDALCDSVRHAAAGDDRLALCVSQGDLNFLHRVAVGRPLCDLATFNRFRARLDVDALRRVAMKRAIAEIGALQIDVVGLSRARDDATLLWALRRILSWTAQTLISAVGDTSSSEKWRLRKLRCVQSAGGPWAALAGAVADLFVDLACARELPGDARSVAARIVSLTNVVVPLAQAGRTPADTLADAFVYRGATRTGWSQCTESGGVRLPHAAADLTVRWDGSRYVARRVFGDAELVLNSVSLYLLVAFDGCRDAADVARSLAEAAGVGLETSRAAVEDFTYLLESARLADRPSEWAAGGAR